LITEVPVIFLPMALFCALASAGRAIPAATGYGGLQV
jgi:hypothetical protein